MSQSTASESRAFPPHDDCIPHLVPRFPRWVSDALGVAPAWVDIGPQMQAAGADSLVLVTAMLAGATALPADALRAEVARTYRGIRRWLSASGCCPSASELHPGIGDPMGTVSMLHVFNAADTTTSTGHPGQASH